METYKIKIMVVGNTNSGKSCLINRYINNIFDINSSQTIGVNCKTKLINNNNKIYNLHILDTAGRIEFKKIISSFYDNYNIYIVVFDVSDSNSYSIAKIYINEIIEHNNNACIYLVGTKCDNDVLISVDNVTNCFPDYKYFQTSAKNNINIDTVFNYIINNNLHTIPVQIQRSSECCCYIS